MLAFSYSSPLSLREACIIADFHPGFKHLRLDPHLLRPWLQSRRSKMAFVAIHTTAVLVFPGIARYDAPAVQRTRRTNT